MAAAIGLGLLSALCFGVADFFGGLLSRRSHSLTVSLLAHSSGVVLVAAAVPFVPAAGVTPDTLLWGGLSGIGTGLGAAALFQAMSIGRFTLSVPLSIIASVALPVVVGACLLREEITVLAWVGIGIATVGLWLLTAFGHHDHTEGGSAGVALALLSGVAFALQFIGLTQAGADAGLWPVLANRIVAVVVVAPLFFAHRLHRRQTSTGLTFAIIATGIAWSAGIVTYTLASRESGLAIAVVLTSLYPVIPVVLGLTVLHERLTRLQATGLVLAAAAVILISS